LINHAAADASGINAKEKNRIKQRKTGQRPPFRRSKGFTYLAISAYKAGLAVNLKTPEQAGVKPPRLSAPVSIIAAQ